MNSKSPLNCSFAIEAFCFSAVSSSLWSHLKKAPPDPVFGLIEAFRRDPRPDKINIGIGVYADDNGSPFVFPVVRKVINLIKRVLYFGHCKYLLLAVYVHAKQARNSVDLLSSIMIRNSFNAIKRARSLTSIILE